ncbi:MAG: tRNA (adenosine(37)-N6)-threonylcarbamoyltransferase complex transferase subunit TsaD [Cyanobacteria bacterium P01_D01_bin.73]
MTIALAIETSCDETAVAIVNKRNVLSSVVASQMEIHAEYGGVVPEVASRHHVEAINPAITQALTEAGAGWDDIDVVAATCAPGLMGALLTGLTAAKTLAMIHGKPFLGMHHLEGHIYASYLTDPQLQPPFVCLLVSGGHTSLIAVRGCGDYELVGQTRDDAAGEAFDKVARLLELGYPGGPVIDRLAATGNPRAFRLPEGRVSVPGGGFHPYDTSFSGLKTAVRYLIERLQKERQQDQPDRPLPVADIAASFQAAVVKALVKRAIAASQNLDIPTVVVGGGVAANSGLRSGLTAAAEPLGIKVIFPPLKFCTDNAAMIACAASEHFAAGRRSPLTLKANSRMAVTQVMDLYQS